MPDLIPIPCRILNETPTGYLVTQERYGSRCAGVWLDKDAVQIPNRAEAKPHHVALVPADLAARKRLGPDMLEGRRAPSPWNAAKEAP